MTARVRSVAREWWHELRGRAGSRAGAGSIADHAASQTHALLGNERAARRQAGEGRLWEDLIRAE